MKIVQIKNQKDLPLESGISAVFFIGFNSDGKILTTKNERGWDIPGGHIEKGESPQEALFREVLEETGARIISAIPFLYLKSNRSKVMVFYKGVYKIVSKNLAEDAEETKSKELNEFLYDYYGDKEMMGKILFLSRSRS